MNAIILAAGMGTRLFPHTKDKPKSLIKINEEAIVERQIRFLKEAKINDITIVVGYYASQFEYLRKKYNIQIIFNTKYRDYNNIYSLFLAREKLGNTYIIEADVYLAENIFAKYDNTLRKSYEYVIQRDTNRVEWIVRYCESKRIKKIEFGVPTNQEYIMSGISYWCSSDTAELKEHLEEIIKEEFHFSEMYWNDIARLHMNKFNLFACQIDRYDCHEIDTVEELENIISWVENRKSKFRS